MDLRRLKTVFIFVLIALNIMFLAVLYNAHNYEKEERKLMAESLSNLLAKSMIYLPANIELPPSPEISNFYLEKMFGNNDDLAERILGSGWTKESDGLYKSKKGRLSVNGSEFEFFSETKDLTVADFSESNIEKICREEMQRLGIFSEFYVFSGINFVDNGTKAIFTAQKEETVFFDAYISFEIGENGISLISGRNMISDLEVNHSQTEFFSIVSILPDIAENPKLKKGTAHTVVSIIPGYYIGNTAESYRNILAIPVWQIATDSGVILYYDARNGQMVNE